MTTKNPFQWPNYRQFPPEIQEQMLEKVKAMLPELPWRQAADVFEDAPAEVILRFLPDLVWEAQVRVYKCHLPMGAQEDAKKLLSEEAQIRLGLRPRYQCLA